jgi:nucleotide-binding universal stress UspA family protein
VINFVSGVGRVVVGTGGSPGSLPALRYARDLACSNGVPLLGAIAWIPPGGDLAERRCPSPALRRAWADAAGDRLKAALEAAWGCVPPDLDIQLVVIRGEPGPSLVHLAGSGDDLLVVGAGRPGRLSRMWHGRVSRYCLSHARCAVVAVPQPATARQMGLSPARWALRHRELTLDQAMREWDTTESSKGRSA